MFKDFFNAENIIALAALVTSFVSLSASKRASKLSEGEIECQLSILIRDGINKDMESRIELERYRQECLNKQIGKSAMEKTDLFKALYANVETNEEVLLNAYEEACAKYLDDKVHRERFRKNYHRQIAKLVESDIYDDKLNKPSSQYKCILTVYNQWYNLEDNQVFEKKFPKRFF